MITISMKLNYKSIELKNYEIIHNVKMLKRLGRKKIYVEFQPPLPRDIYNRANDIDKAILIPRYPCIFFAPALMVFKVFVNLCIEKKDDLGRSSLTIIDIGYLVKKYNFRANQKFPIS